MSRATRAITFVSLMSLPLAVGCQGVIEETNGPNARTNQGGGGAFGNIDPASTDVGQILSSVQCTSAPVGVTAPLRSLTPIQYQNSIRALFDGKIDPSTSFPKPAGTSLTGYSSDSTMNALAAGFAEGVAAAADQVALSVMGKITDVLSCASAKNRACAETFVDKYASKAFRRPLDGAEKSALLAVFDAGMSEHKDFNVAIAEVTAAILQHPLFVYVPELGKLEDGQRKLDDYEIASRLSLLLWDSAPDAELLRAAGAHELSDDAGVKRQAQRLIDDARFEAVLARFVREWTHIDKVEAGGKDPNLFPELDTTLASSISQELDRFVVSAVRRGQGGFEALVAGRDTFVNAPLASLYGMQSSSSSADEWVPVTTEPERAGILTRAAVLAGFAGPTEPSHVHRGKFVLTGLMCSKIGAPPANAAAMQPAYPQGATRRERSAVLQQTSPCGGCHTQIDPIGLAFDDFDALGKRLGGSVDVSGNVLTGPDDMKGSFHGAAELADTLANSQAVRECVGRQWFRFSFGRVETAPDACTYASVAADLAKSNGDLASMFASVATSAGFRFRKTTGE